MGVNPIGVKPMGVNTERRAALSAGVLFITATLASVVGTGLSRSVLDECGLPRSPARGASPVSVR
jgi:ABC-type transport system involved in cytochrome c biogenesis permease component